MNEEKIRKFIFNELSKFKFKKYTKGFKYLNEVIYICIIDIDAIDNLNKNVFPKISNKYHEKSYLNVKWCIEGIINTMYNNTEMDIVSKYFNLEDNVKPSLKLITYTIVCKYNLEISDKKHKN